MKRISLALAMVALMVVGISPAAQAAPPTTASMELTIAAVGCPALEGLGDTDHIDVTITLDGPGTITTQLDGFTLIGVDITTETSPGVFQETFLVDQFATDWGMPVGGYNTQITVWEDQAAWANNDPWLFRETGIHVQDPCWTTDGIYTTTLAPDAELVITGGSQSSDHTGATFTGMSALLTGIEGWHPVEATAPLLTLTGPQGTVVETPILGGLPYYGYPYPLSIGDVFTDGPGLYTATAFGLTASIEVVGSVDPPSFSTITACVKGDKLKTLVSDPVECKANETPIELLVSD